MSTNTPKMFNTDDIILPEDISEEDKEKILKRVADEIVSRRLTAPAIFLLESCRPLSFIGSQAMIVFEPVIHAIFNLPDYRKFAILMEKNENVEKLIAMIEIGNHDYKAKEKQKKEQRKISHRISRKNKEKDFKKGK